MDVYNSTAHPPIPERTSSVATDPIYRSQPPAGHLNRRTQVEDQPPQLPPLQTGAPTTAPAPALTPEARQVIEAKRRILELEEQCRTADFECRSLWTQLESLGYEYSRQKQLEQSLRQLEVETESAMLRLQRHAGELSNGRWSSFDVRMNLPYDVVSSGNPADMSKTVDSMLGAFAQAYAAHMAAEQNLTILKLRIMSQQQWIRDARALLVTTDAGTERDADAVPTVSSEREDLQLQITSMETYRDGKQQQQQEEEAGLVASIQDHNAVLNDMPMLLELLQAELDKAQAGQAMADLLVAQHKMEADTTEAGLLAQIAELKEATIAIKEGLRMLEA
ncbi:hypothetical protein HDU93_007504 [Gonapodya sp. JEL0774]|nr:hypothetical protein HDU93_007504 [Gonapodya sp. JEL0774]